MSDPKHWTATYAKSPMRQIEQREMVTIERAELDRLQGDLEKAEAAYAELSSDYVSLQSDYLSEIS